MSQIKTWVVVEPHGVDHSFEDEAAALKFAAHSCHADKGTTVRYPDGEEIAIVRRHPKIQLYAMRGL